MNRVLFQNSKDANQYNELPGNINKIKCFKQLYDETKQKLLSLNSQQSPINIFQSYYNQILKYLGTHSQNDQQRNEKVQKQRVNSISELSRSNQEVQDPSHSQQLSYGFLRKIWQRKYCTQKLKQYDSEDHIDKLNKIVAMMRTRITYMTKKENYLYEKQQSNHNHVYENPHFVKIKQQMQRLKMQNEELKQKNVKQSEQNFVIKQQKRDLETKYQNLKKKYQQIQKNWIEVSKKNICLEQESLGMKTQSSKKKLNQLRQNNDINLYSSIQLSKSLSFKKISEQMEQKSKRKQEISQDFHRQKETTLNIFKPIQNVFIDISLKQEKPQNVSCLKQSKQAKVSNRYQKSKVDANNEEVETEHQSKNKQDSTQTNLNINFSQRCNTNKQSMNFKYIKYQGSGRKALLSSVKSVDLAEKTSIAKPKFERTKTNYQNLLKSVGKQGLISSQQCLQNGSKLRNKNIFSGGSQLFNISRSPCRENVIKKEVTSLI